MTIARRFYYRRKVNCLPAEGHVAWGNERFDFKPTNTLGNLDWGRCIWDYCSFWVRASAPGFLPNSRMVGLNLGFGLGDTPQTTENALILNAVFTNSRRVISNTVRRTSSDRGKCLRPTTASIWTSRRSSSVWRRRTCCSSPAKCTRCLGATPALHRRRLCVTQVSRHRYRRR